MKRCPVCNSQLPDNQEIPELVPLGYHEDALALSIKKRIAAEEKLHWIPVSERLPVNSNLIMFYTKYDGMRMGRFNGDDWNTVCNVKFSKMAVTHWMPLPEPPQEVE